MKRMIVAALVACGALSVIGADDYTGFYKSNGSWADNKIGVATVTVYDRNGEESGSASFLVDSDGNIDWGNQKQGFAKTTEGAIAIQALEEALRAQVMTDNFAKNLAALMGNGGIVVKDAIVDSDGNTRDLEIRIDPRQWSNMGAGDMLTGEPGTTIKEGENVEIDGVSLLAVDDKIRIAGWNTAEPAGYSIADVLAGRYSEFPELSEVELLARTGKDLYPSYVKIGTGFGIGNAAVDGESITTNTADGAESDGVASLKYWGAAKDSASQSDPYIPYTMGNSLGWHGLASFVDGETIKKMDSDGKLTLSGWTSGMGNRHYFGTSDGSTPGFYELPNAVTNRVEGDEVAITSDTEEDENGSVKKLKIKGWDSVSSFANDSPSFLVKNEDGSIGSMPIQSSMTNRVEGDDVAISSNTEIEDGGTVTVISLKGWNSVSAFSGNAPSFLVKNSDGSIGAMPLDNVATNIDSCACSQKWEKVETWTGLTMSDAIPFGIPSDWLDSSVFKKNDDGDGKFTLQGWDSPICEKTIGGMMTDPLDPDTTKHRVLAMYTDGGSKTIHYVNLGHVPTPDTAYFTEDSNTHKFSLRGAASNSGKYLRSTGAGIEWAEASGSAGDVYTAGSGISIDPASDNEISVRIGEGLSFDDDGAVSASVKGATGGVTIDSDGNVTGDYTGDGGITVDNANGTISFDDGCEVQSITFVTDVTWDENAHALKVEKMTIPVKVQKNFHATPVQSTVFTAVSHESEYGSN